MGIRCDELIRSLELVGFVKVRQRKHIQIVHPDGRRLSLPGKLDETISGFMEAQGRKWAKDAVHRKNKAY